MKQLLGDEHAAERGDRSARSATATRGADEIAFAVRKLLRGGARERPLVVVFDDLHWAEPTFLDLIEHVADWSRDAPILLLCLARPELLDLRPSWGGGKLNATTVLLEPLTADETDELIDALLAGAPGSTDDLRERIRAAAEGNPLFVEEMLAMVEDSPGRRDRAADDPGAARRAARPAAGGRARRARARRGRGQVFHRGAVAGAGARRPDVPSQLIGLVRKELVRPSRRRCPATTRSASATC